MTVPIVYTGIKFPFQKGTASFPAAATDDDLIRDSLIQLVLTAVGERIMRPEFGTNALTFVFENNDAVLSNLLRAEIQGVIARFEPRVQLTDIRIEQQASELILTIIYLILATGKMGAVAVPVPLP